MDCGHNISEWEDGTKVALYAKLFGGVENAMNQRNVSTIFGVRLGSL